MTAKEQEFFTEATVGELTAKQVSSRSTVQSLLELFDDDRALVVELDARGRIVSCNRGFADASGYACGECLNRFPPDFLSRSSAAPSAYPLLPGEQWLCKNGDRRTIQWLNLWTWPDDGAGFMKLGRCREVESPGNDAASRVQLQAFLDAAPDAIITINDRGRIVSVNPATERLFDYGRAEMMGRNVSMLMPAPDRDRHDGYIRHYLDTGEARIIGIGREITARRKDGSTFPARLSVSEFESQGERFFTGMLHDITERVEAEERQRAMLAEHAHQSRVVALGEMASGIAHEINQPLTAIVSFADASRKQIENQRYDVEALQHALKQISEQGRRAGQIIRRLRDFVKKKEPNRASIDINELIRAAAGMTTHDADRYGIALTFDLEPRPSTGRVDRLQVEQVILNLIRNSIDSINQAGRRDGEIRICSHLDRKAFNTTVSDNGVGIDPAERSHVFNPFYSTKEKGTGLGLSISRSIAEAHGGELSFEPNKGHGVTFTLKLPVDADD